MNELAYRHLCGPKGLAVVPGVARYDPDPGVAEDVARLAVGWFGKHLAAPDGRGDRFAGAAADPRRGVPVPA